MAARLGQAPAGIRSKAKNPPFPYLGGHEKPQLIHRLPAPFIRHLLAEHRAQRLDAFTQLGAALHFYGIALRYAPTPQAKGKIERRHDYWQQRLPPLLAADQITELAPANQLLDQLLDQLLTHANAHETHRELGTTPQAARDQARAEKRSGLRPVPACPGWPFVWSQRTRVRVGDDGKVSVGSQRHPLDAPPRSHVVRCLRPNGDLYYLRHAPEPNTQPQVLLHCPVF
ncbi:MAG: hypothetical protein IPM17_17150 [Verrucomicrobia bacterium]|nr:hypothetical protein [Verrucomicrobiota bacterium]